MSSEVLQITGEVRASGKPLEAAYVDLLDEAGEFIAQSRTGPDGRYAFYTTPGRWTLLCRAAGREPVGREVDAPGGLLQLDFDLT